MLMYHSFSFIQEQAPKHAAILLSGHLLTLHGWQVLVTGVERERALLETVVQQAPQARYLIGGTSLAEYAALIEHAALVICNDTLPMHLADAVATPEVVLFSGTDYEEQWRPRLTSFRLLRRQTVCHPCYLFECPIGLACLDILPEEVVEAVQTLLTETGIVKMSGYPLITGGN
jgi:ADP-heptose:LPS heptosyltransferase